MKRTDLETAAPLVPPHPTLKTLRESAAACRACPLWERGTATVFGEGPARARLLLVGEQPGNEEDLSGRPFAGPAGRLLDSALEQAGIARSDAYVTNAVKHFKWEPRGKRRIHSKPNTREVAACRPWLEAEIAVVKPEVVVCLGATAAQSLLGCDFRVTARRGERIPWIPPVRFIVATIHPSSILRAPDTEQRHAEMGRFIADLRVAADAAGSNGPIRQAGEV